MTLSIGRLCFTPRFPPVPKTGTGTRRLQSLARGQQVKNRSYGKEGKVKTFVNVRWERGRSAVKSGAKKGLKRGGFGVVFTLLDT